MSALPDKKMTHFMVSVCCVLYVVVDLSFNLVDKMAVSFFLPFYVLFHDISAPVFHSMSGAKDCGKPVF